ncbi:MAG: hypothetical protein Q4C34_02520 [Bacteroidales bacterium]|nr:hypothetical protein [Bacteroidales bacterium]
MIKSRYKVMKHIFVILISLFCSLSFSTKAADFKTGTTSEPSLGHTEIYNTVDTYQTTPLKGNSLGFKNTPEWKKFKIMRAVGWSCFGCGLGIGAFGGLLAMAVAIEKGDFIGAPLICTVVGGSLIVASVPILAMGYHYKNKAKKMALEMSLTRLYTPQPERLYAYAHGIGFILKF